MKRLVSYLLIVVIAALCGWLIAKKWQTQTPDSPTLEVVQRYASPRALPNFTLSQPDGSLLTPASLQGRWTVAFLGFTFCPDICPTTLSELAHAQNTWQGLPADQRPRILFISADPQRDTPTQLAQYVHAFHTDTLAATTTDLDALKAFTDSLNLVAMKVPGKKFADNPLDYTIDHSANLVVINPQGQLAGLIRPPLDAAAIARDMVLLNSTPQ